MCDYSQQFTVQLHSSQKSVYCKMLFNPFQRGNRVLKVAHLLLFEKIRDALAYAHKFYRAFFWQNKRIAIHLRHGVSINICVCNHIFGFQRGFIFKKKCLQFKRKSNSAWTLNCLCFQTCQAFMWINRQHCGDFLLEHFTDLVGYFAVVYN